MTEERKSSDEIMEEWFRQNHPEIKREPQSLLALGITPDYAWYESEQIQRQIDGINSRFRHLISVLEERSRDQNKMIDQLMEANRNLSRQIKEMKK